jgi:hypothetical protein
MIRSALSSPLRSALSSAFAVRRGGGGAFDPATLFGGTKKGFAYDFVSPSLLFQNSNGTGAVAANSDPIGYVTDLSGNGRHGIQATAGNRPLYSTGGVGASFNGTSQFLAATGVDFSGTDKVTVIASCRITTSGNLGLVGHGSSSAGDFNVLYSSGSASWRASLHGSTGNAQVTINASDKPALPHTKVFTTVFDLAGATAADEVLWRMNGEAVAETVVAAGPAGGGNFANRTTEIGRVQGAFYMNGNVARVIVIQGVLTDAELFAAEQWVGQGAGVVVLPLVPPAGDADINHLFSYGQSLSVGTQSRPAISTTDNNHYTFTGTGRVRAWDSVSPYTALQPHRENDSAAELMGETPCYGAYQMIGERTTYTKQFLASAPGYGALTIAELSKPSGYYTRMIADVTNGRKLSRASGKSFKVRAFTWMQGEGDGGNASYAANMNSLLGDMNTDIKAITSQTEDLWMISYQVARAQIGLAHLAASNTYARIRVAMPMYHLPTTDGVHLTAASSKIAGAYFGLAYKALILDGDTSWQPLKCTGSSVVGQTIDLTYNRSGLVFDTTTVSAQTNQGFRVLDAGLTPLTISSVSIVGGNTVRIVVASGTPATVYYGFASATNHTAGTDKGNLRDSMGDSIVFDTSSLNYPMHNWAVLQSVAL